MKDIDPVDEKKELRENPVEQKKLIRKDAIMWWISLPSEYKFRIKRKHFPEKNTYHLNGREIEHIYTHDRMSPYEGDKLRNDVGMISREQRKHA